MLWETTLNDVLPRLNLSEVRRSGAHNIYLCPFCGDEKGHLYVNMDSGLWCCFLCGEKGNPLVLYAKCRNISNRQAYKELHFGRPKRTESAVPEPPRLIPEAPIEHRDAVYREFLGMLPLYRRHAVDLKRRGFTKEQVIKNLYRSLPDEREKRDEIASTLASKYDLTGVRGFRKRNGKWEFFYAPGYLIPFRDAKGRIQALQIRTDRGDPKYLFFSFRDSGIDNSTPVHVVNPDATKRTKSAWVTEGPLKADAASTEINSCIVAPPGVSSWRAAVRVLDELGVKEVVQAFDLDQDEKPAVKKCVHGFENALGRRRVLRALWPKELGNGLDDAVLSIRKIRSLEIEASACSIKIREVKETEFFLARAVSALKRKIAGV